MIKFCYEINNPASFVDKTTLGYKSCLSLSSAKDFIARSSKQGIIMREYWCSDSSELPRLQEFLVKLGNTTARNCKIAR